MSFPLKATLAMLAAACVLLLAGAFPLMEAEGVYRGGAMLLAGILLLVCAAWGAWRLSAGHRKRLIGGCICLFFAGAGVAVTWQFAAMGIRMAQTGGPLWMGAVAMFCTALTGVLFTGIFGYFCHRAMNSARLWLAGAHACFALLLCGAYTDYFFEQRADLMLTAGSGQEAKEVTTAAGETLPLGFGIQVDSFSVTHYDNVSYTLYTMRQGQPTDPQPVEQKGDRLCFGNESRAASELKTAPGMPRPFLLLEGEPPRVILQNAPTVKDYSAACTIHTDHKGRPETRHEALRVNEPLECKGWLIYLTNYRDTPHGAQVQLQARRAPGRIPALSGIVGLLICLPMWCAKRRNG